jgi:hypothetical protein
MIKKYIIPVVALLMPCAAINAQNSLMLDSVKNEIYRINKVFDSSGYMGFSLNIQYCTDTAASGACRRDEKNVEYQYIQNDSFTVNIDHTEKSMIVTKNNFNQLSGSFMLKDFLNNSLAFYSSVYTITIVDVDSLYRTILFVTNDILSPYKNFSVTYDNETYQPKFIEAALTEKLEVTDDSSQTDLLNQNLKLTFLNYRLIPTGKIFDEQNYFFKNKATKRCMPADKYKYYHFITAGIDEDELEDNPQVLKDNSNLPGGNNNQ